MARVLVISDLQCPFQHPKYLAFLQAIEFKYRTTTTVCVGDEVDHHALGDYEHDPDGYSAGFELTKAIEALKPYYKAFPKAYICESNHTMRILKRVFKAGIPVRYMKDFKEVIQAPKGWGWRPKWEIDGITYKHGLGYSGALGAINAAKDEMRPCVIGHLHSDAGILFWNNGEKTIWGMNVGSGIDENAYAFKYAKYARKKSIISCGVVIDGEPFIIRMPT